MTRRAIALATVILGLCAPPCLAEREGFAGAWVLDTERSDPLRRGGDGLPHTQMTITQQGEDVAIERIYRFQGQARPVSWTYITDNEPHELPGLMGSTRRSRSRWKKDKLVVSYTLSRDTPRGSFDLDVVETWTLSKDGQEIVISYSTRVGERNQVRKERYVRAEP